MSTARSYDEVPYEDHAFPQTHPDRLASIGRLFGLTPAPIDRCRVLELGCAGGANLIPMAFRLADSEFVGVDFSSRQIERARETARDLGLSNIDLRHGDIDDVDASWGRFDYVICHGVYSWVPDPVKRKILQICRHNLGPQGVAYVSYNTYPGWHDREKIRDLMLFHSVSLRDPAERIAEARGIAELLAGLPGREDAPNPLQALAEEIKDRTDPYLFHEYLEEVNEPVYFAEFIARADREGLQYLGEAQLSQMLGTGFPEKTRMALARNSPIRYEQYLDFVCNRRFRQTLLCHKDALLDHFPLATVSPELPGAPETVRLSAAAVERMSHLRYASDAILDDPDVDLRAGKTYKFETPWGAMTSTDKPIVKAILAVLGSRHPLSLGFEDLAAESFGRLSRVFPNLDRAAFADQLAAHLFLRCMEGIVRPSTLSGGQVGRVSDKPRASRLAIHQASRGDRVVTQNHAMLRNLGPETLELIRLLDGTRDRRALLESLTSAVRSGRLVPHRQGEAIADVEEAVRFIEDGLDGVLYRLMNESVLVG